MSNQINNTVEFVINNKSSDVPDNLHKIIQTANKVSDEMIKLLNLFNDDNIKNTGTFMLMFDDNLFAQILGKLQLCKNSAQMEMTQWENIKDMSFLQRATYFSDFASTTSN